MGAKTPTVQKEIVEVNVRSKDELTGRHQPKGVENHMNIIRIVLTVVLITVGVILINGGCMPTSPQEKSVTLDNIQGMWYLSEYTYSSIMDTTLQYTESNTVGFIYITGTAYRVYFWRDRTVSPVYGTASYTLNGSTLYLTSSGVTVAYTLSFRGASLVMFGDVPGNYSVTSTYTPYRGILPPPGWPVN